MAQGGEVSVGDRGGKNNKISVAGNREGQKALKGPKQRLGRLGVHRSPERRQRRK
ncbi:hypothetical protein HPP92_005389 [Vanilla planifolia]|uniref:Uncharacterized protein n=1 Tax=Vanilla planifolia TaxID=51239 RepID=A0A835VEU2_VANPL|nr:hypothetical protein HPP92_005389 [Vanilla planifolia]